MLNSLVFKYIQKTSAIKKIGSVIFDPKQTFFYIPLPQEIQDKYSKIGKKLFGEQAAEINDHITLLYLPKKEQPTPQEELNKIINMLNGINIPPVQAKVQGWAYFDGASEGKTALVALIDTPGLEELHVLIKNGMRSLGYDVTQNHGFNPHTTFCYLDRGERVDNLPVLEDSFIIDRFSLASDKNYRFKLKE